jgi:hypothetical protein
MFLPTLVLLAACIALPLAQAWRLGRLRAPDRLGWLLAALDATVFVSVILVAGRWDIAGYGTRFVLVALLVAALLRSWHRHRGLPWRAGRARGARARRWTSLLPLLAFGAVLGWLLAGMSPSAPAREMAFPLRDGRFVVGQGGVVGLLNQHAGHRQQAHAADIVALNAFGFRAAGILPDRLEAYAIWGAEVASPCDGVVAGASDGLPDLAPGVMDPGHPAGNHVVLECAGVRVLLAHLREGSVAVAPGDRVVAGASLGRVGNSGNTTEPHLHIHAFDPASGDPVPLRFGGRAPVRNRLFLN